VRRILRPLFVSSTFPSEFQSTKSLPDIDETNDSTNILIWSKNDPDERKVDPVVAPIWMCYIVSL
jgi:hypothetical protein